MPNTLLTASCLSYLSACKFATRKISSDEELKDFLGSEEHPLCDYAYRHWGTHAAGCHEEGGIPDVVLLQWGHYPFITEGGNFDLFERDHIAVYYGLRDGLLPGNEWYNQPTSIMKFTPLILACTHGNKDTVQLLLSCSNVTINTQTEKGRTALIAASDNGHEAVVKLLLSCSDVAINTQTENGWTALSIASGNGHEAVVKLLLSHSDVAINTQTKDGRTALYAASDNGHEAVVKLLLSRSDVVIDTQTEDDRTALSAAFENGHKSIVDLLSKSFNVDKT